MQCITLVARLDKEVTNALEQKRYTLPKNTEIRARGGRHDVDPWS